MTNYDERRIKSIRARYEEPERSAYDEVIELERRVTRPALVLAYVLGVIGSLILGVGMCLAMQVIGFGGTLDIVLGVAIGLVGILIVSVNYPLYKRILAGRRAKYADEMKALTDLLIGE